MSDRRRTYRDATLRLTTVFRDLHARSPVNYQLDFLEKWKSGKTFPSFLGLRLTFGQIRNTASRFATGRSHRYRVVPIPRLFNHIASRLPTAWLPRAVNNKQSSGSAIGNRATQRRRVLESPSNAASTVLNWSDEPKAASDTAPRSLRQCRPSVTSDTVNPSHCGQRNGCPLPGMVRQSAHRADQQPEEARFRRTKACT